MFRRIRVIDNRVLDGVSAIHCRFLDVVMVMFTYAGTGAFVWWVVLAVPFLLSAPYRKAGMILIVALGVNYELGEIIIKKAVGRDRPSTLLPEDEMIINKPKDHSFPSGHSASSFCAFAVTAICCPYFIWAPALFGALMISFSRLYLRVHYLSDVLAGIALGLIDGTVIAVLFKQVVLVNLEFLV